MANEPWELKEVVPTGLDAWQVNQNLLAYGRCPRCGHDATQQLHRSGTVVVANTQPADLDALARFTCNCNKDHAGRPAGLEGCGALWVVRVKEVGTHDFEFSPESDAALREAASARAMPHATSKSRTPGCGCARRNQD